MGPLGKLLLFSFAMLTLPIGGFFATSYVLESKLNRLLVGYFFLDTYSYCLLLVAMYEVSM